jgi:hypothetical protein
MAKKKRKPSKRAEVTRKKSRVKVTRRKKQPHKSLQKKAKTRIKPSVVEKFVPTQSTQSAQPTQPTQLDIEEFTAPQERDVTEIEISPFPPGVIEPGIPAREISEGEWEEIEAFPVDGYYKYDKD